MYQPPGYLRANLLIALFLFGTPIVWVWSALWWEWGDLAGKIILALGAAGLLFAFVERLVMAPKRWRQKLLDKYGDAACVDRIRKGVPWKGQTVGQLLDSLGKPSAKDEKSTKTINRTVWKYHPSGSNRYRLRVTVEDGLVAGWERKG